MKKRNTRKRKRAAATDAAPVSEPIELAAEEPHQPAPAHRRVRAGELYYVTDEAAPEGWSIIEIASSDSGVLAAFALGQLEAIPLSEVEGLILSAVQRPPHNSRPLFAA